MCSREVRLSPVRLAVYELLAERRRNGCGRVDCKGCNSCFVPAAEMSGCFQESLRARLKARESLGVGIDKWGEGNFRAERSKINQALQRSLRAASAPFEIQAIGEKGSRRCGLLLDPHAMRSEGS